MNKIDINCDLGESYGIFKLGHDQELMPLITSANIACGFHSGDPDVMSKTVNLAIKNNVAIGAHPGLPDLKGFGRRPMTVSLEEIRNMLLYQIGALDAIAQASKKELQHVKLHGALYNTVANDEKYAKIVIETIKSFNPHLILFTPAKSKIEKIARSHQLRVASEVFADRAYNSDGSLLPRSQNSAVIEDVNVISRRALSMIQEQSVKDIDEKPVKFDNVHTICVHGDNPKAPIILKALRKLLSKSKVEVAPVGSFL